MSDELRLGTLGDEIFGAALAGDGMTVPIPLQGDGMTVPIPLQGGITIPVPLYGEEPAILLSGITVPIP